MIKSISSARKPLCCGSSQGGIGFSSREKRKEFRIRRNRSNAKIAKVRDGRRWLVFPLVFRVVADLEMREEKAMPGIEAKSLKSQEIRIKSRINAGCSSESYCGSLSVVGNCV
jgi:hypothetical protein